MNKVLARWNRLSRKVAVEQILACCGSSAWAERMTARRPIREEASLIGASDEIWSGLGPADWEEAFAQHPRIGERNASPGTWAQSAAWSVEEQQNVAAGDAVRLSLSEANREYERRFRRVFIVCASGRSASEILEILKRRLRNDDTTEWREAAEEQRKITNLRLQKWLRG